VSLTRKSTIARPNETCADTARPEGTGRHAARSPRAPLFPGVSRRGRTADHSERQCESKRERLHNVPPLHPVSRDWRLVTTWGRIGEAAISQVERGY